MFSGLIMPECGVTCWAQKQFMYIYQVILHMVFVFELEIAHRAYKLPALMGFHMKAQPSSASEAFPTNGTLEWHKLVIIVRNGLVIHCWILGKGYVIRVPVVFSVNPATI